MSERNCNTCTHVSKTLSQEPCRSCFGKDYYPNWESIRVEDKEIAEQFSRACTVAKELREKMRKDADEWEKLAQRLLERAKKAEAENAELRERIRQYEEYFQHNYDEIMAIVREWENTGRVLFNDLPHRSIMLKLWQAIQKAVKG